MNLLNKLSNAAVVQYILTLMDVLLHRNRSFATTLLKLQEINPGLPYRPLTKMLTTGLAGTEVTTDVRFAFLKALRVLGFLLLAEREPSQENVLFLVRWCAHSLRKESDEDVRVAALALKTVLQRHEFRMCFLQNDGLKILHHVLSSSTDRPQLYYDACMCLWLMCYTDDIAEAVGQVDRFIASLVDVLRIVEQEKIRRILLATLRNLLGYGTNSEQMVEAGIMRALMYLNQRKWADSDVADDLEQLTKQLEQVMADMNSFERYKVEVLSGSLDWTLCHRSETFWRENAGRLEEHEARLLKALHNIIRTGHDMRSVAVACFDVGEYVRYRPRGRLVIAKLGIKDEILRCISHPDGQVQKQAIVALQKLLTQNWENMMGN